MARQKHIFLIALAASLALHLASLGIVMGYAHLRGRDTRVAKASANPQTQPADEMIVYPDMGDAQGTGIGSNSSPGEQPLVAREADEDQALLSRNPQGAGRVQARPSDRRGPEGDGTGGARAIAPPAMVQAPVEKAAPKPAPAEQPSIQPATPPVPNPQPPQAPAVTAAPPAPALNPRDPLSIAETPAPPVPRVEVARVTPAPPAPEKSEVKPAPDSQKQDAAAQSRDGAASAKPQAAQTGDGRRRGVPPAAGNPLPQSESDSDPFSRISGNVVVTRLGRLDVRMGRKVKTTRPQVNIAGQMDLIALNNPLVVLEVHIAPTGNVTDVRIAHSSGSNGIDEPTRVAVYDWWFEPAKDKSGKPVPDVIYFAIQFL